MTPSLAAYFFSSKGKVATIGKVVGVQSRWREQQKQSRCYQGIVDRESSKGRVTAIKAESSARMPFGPVSPFRLLIVRVLMGHYGQSQTLGQGQDIGRHPSMLSHCYHRSLCYPRSHRREAESRRECLLGLLALLGLCPNFPIFLKLPKFFIST